MAFWREPHHLVWCTRDRQPLIQPEIEAALFPYLVRRAAELGVYVYAVNGWTDHAHLVVAIPPKQAVAGVVKHLQGASAHYLNHSTVPGGQFAWQRGYGALSVGERARPIADAYARNQKVHHAEQSTNGWMEYCTADDEGPPDTGGDPASDFVREEMGGYQAWGPPLV